jgi:hypothetical protein
MTGPPSGTASFRQWLRSAEGASLPPNGWPFFPAGARSFTAPVTGGETLRASSAPARASHPEASVSDGELLKENTPEDAPIAIDTCRRRCAKTSRQHDGKRRAMLPFCLWRACQLPGDFNWLLLNYTDVLRSIRMVLVGINKMSDMLVRDARAWARDLVFRKS